MSNENIFSQRRKVTPAELTDTQAAPVEASRPASESAPGAPNLPFPVKGTPPPEFLEAMQRAMSQSGMPPVAPPPPVTADMPFEPPQDRPRRTPTPDAKVHDTPGSDALKDLLQRLADEHVWEEFEFPSLGKFYTNIPAKVHVRAMTGEEEQILATPRYVKKGKAMDMIFRRCIREDIPTEDLLSADRIHLLIYLRGISYTSHYDVSLKCPNCSAKFEHTIDLNELEVELCPDSFTQESLSGVLPASGFRYTYRLSTGGDEQEVTTYREKRIADFGDQGQDDSLLHRTALLLEEIEGVTQKKELGMLLRKLPIQDVAHLRNEINTPPFGVDTELPILCPSCSEDFKIDLPLETSFFFPRKKTKETQA